MTAQVASGASEARNPGIRPWIALAAVLLAGNGLLLAAPPGPMRTAGALVTLVLPGLAFAEIMLSGAALLPRWIVGAGLGYAFIIIGALALAHLPGPPSRWAVLVLADGLSLALLLALRRSGRGAASDSRDNRLIPLAMVLLVAGFFRLASLGYSEFQGDEVKAMMPAARVLEGDPDALVLGRKKGPAEILLPMLPWRLSETTDEASARLPFALAGLGTLATLFLLGRKLGGDEAGLAAAAVGALNGLLIAFSRIVQYQAVVLWMSALAVYCAWEWCESRRTRWALLAGVFTGVGLLAHYDALVVVPVLAAIALFSFSRSGATGRRWWWRDVLLGALCAALVVIPFYGPYLLTSQVGQTETYLGYRFGEGLFKNRVDSFLAYGFFYGSFLYIALTGGLILAFMAWRVHGAPLLRGMPGARIWAPGLMVLTAVALMVWPGALTIGALDLAPFAWLLIFLAAILLPRSSPAIQCTLLWLAVAFVGYNFLLSDPRTHIYGIFLPWSLLAGAALAALWDAWKPARSRWAGIALAGGVVACLCLFLFDNYLRQDIGRGSDRPAVLRALAWAPEPYNTPPAAGIFGLVHRSGWKAIGALYAEGKLTGDFDANEKPEMTSWYVPGAHRLTPAGGDRCGASPRYYFVADDLVTTSPTWLLELSELAGYAEIGRVDLPSGSGVTLYETNPASTAIGRFDARTFSRRFDEEARPARFTEGPRPSQEIGANFGGLIRLAGYDLRRTGESLVLTLFWEAIQAPGDDYHAFVHIEGGPDGAGSSGVWGQSDGAPGCDGGTTGSWLPGDRIVDRHIISPAPETLPGSYSLIAGLYRPDTGERLPVLDGSGNPIADSVALESVELPLP